MKRNENIVIRKIHESIFLIDISDNYSHDHCALYEINEIGKFIWENIDKHQSTDDLVNLLKSVIVGDVDEKVLYADINDFINELKENKFLTEDW